MPAGRVDAVHAPEIPAADLAKSYGLELRPEVADGVPIRVVDAATGKPVADACIIAVATWPFFWDSDCSVHEDPSAAAQLAALGTAYATATDGRTRVAASNQPLTLFAWHGDRFGRVEVGMFDRSEREISLANRDLVVEVVDAVGRPLPEVPVALGRTYADPEALGPWRGVTGSDGRVTIAAIDAERASSPRDAARRIALTFDFPTTVWEVVALDEPRAGPRKLVLPQCTDFHIEFQHADGRPFRENVSVDIRPSRVDDPPSDSLLKQSRAAAHWLRVATHEGRLDLPRVELGIDITADAWSDHAAFDSIWRDESSHITQPTALVLRAKSGVVLVRGRALDEQRQPLAQVRLTGFAAAADEWKWRDSVTTSPDGSFALTFAANEFGDASELQLVRFAERALAPWEHADVLAHGRATLERASVTNGTRDVGDVVVAPLPLLVSGRVVDEDGRPMRGVVVLIKTAAEEPSSSSSGRSSRPTAAAPDSWFARVASVEVLTDAAGAFERHWLGASPGDRVVANGGPGWFSRVVASAPTPFRPGDANVELRVERASVLEFSARIGAAIDGSLIRVAATGRSGQTEEQQLSSQRPEATSELYLAPDTYHLRVSFADPWRGDVELFSVEEINVGKNQRVRDPRTLAVDLRGRLIHRVVAVVDDAGRPLSGRITFLAPEDHADTGRFQVFAGGQLTIDSLADGPNPAVIRAPGCRPLELASVRDVERAVLHRGREIEIELDPAFALPAHPPLRFYVSLSEWPLNDDRQDDTRADDDSSAEEPRAIAIRPGARARFTIPDAGPRRVRFALCRGDRALPSTPADYQWVATTNPVDVRDSDEPQCFVVAPDRDEFAAAVAELATDEQ